jgi:hypothetical protein
MRAYRRGGGYVPRLGRPGTLKPRGLDAWLASVDMSDPALGRFAADVALIVRHGLPPRAAVAALLRAVVDDAVAERRELAVSTRSATR